MPHNCQALQQPFSSSSTLNVDIPKASLNYVAETGKRAAILISGKLNEVPNFVSTDQFVKDARLVQPSPTIADFGFQLITHKTNLSKRDFYVHESQKIHPVYYGEIADAVKKVFPDAAHIKVFHHAVCYSILSLSSNLLWCANKLHLVYDLYLVVYRYQLRTSVGKYC